MTYSISEGIMLFLIPAVLMIVFCSLYARDMIRGPQLRTVYLKIATSACFVAAGMIAALSRAEADKFCLFLIAGAFCGLIGDLLLGMRYADAARVKGYTNGGFVAFMFGHVCYMIYMLMRYHAAFSVEITLLVIVIAIVLGLIIGRTDRMMGMDYTGFRAMITCYSIVILSSTLLGICYAVERALLSPAADLFAIGAIFFLISDLILSGTYFGEGKNRPVDIISNHVFYFGGQFLIALAIFF